MIIDADAIEEAQRRDPASQPKPKAPGLTVPPLEPPPPYSGYSSDIHRERDFRRQPRVGSGSDERARLLDDLTTRTIPPRARTQSTRSTRQFMSFFSSHGIPPPPSPLSPGSVDDNEFDYKSASCFECVQHYFAPLGQEIYYMSLIHLLLFDFPFAIIAWAFILVGVILGTSLLIIMPAGGMIWFLTLLCARGLANIELHIQAKFQGPLPVHVALLQQPILPFPAQRADDDWQEITTLLDRGETRTIRRRSAFRERITHLFTDRQSFKALFYFLVIKPFISLCCLISTSVVLGLGLAFVFTIPLALRWIRQIGEWQMRAAVDALI